LYLGHVWNLLSTVQKRKDTLACRAFLPWSWLMKVSGSIGVEYDLTTATKVKLGGRGGGEGYLHNFAKKILGDFLFFDPTNALLLRISTSWHGEHNHPTLSW
jgi:hypothetical protein